MGVGVGLHVMDIEVAFTGVGSVGGAQKAVVETEEAVLAPVPNLWAYGSWALSPSTHAGLGWLSLSYGKYHDQMFTLSGNLEYRFTERIGLGVGYRLLNLNLDVDDEPFRHGFEADQYGPFAYLAVGF